MSDALSATFIKFLSGSIAFLITLTFLVGPENVGSFIFVWVVCSFGTAIPFGLAIAYLFGFLIDEFIFLRYFRKSDSRLSLKGILPQNSEERAITEYIRNAKKYYMSEDTIRQMLLESGWDKRIIDRAFNVV